MLQEDARDTVYGVLRTEVFADEGEKTSKRTGLTHYNITTTAIAVENGTTQHYKVNIDIQSNPKKPDVLCCQISDYSTVSNVVKMFSKFPKNQFLQLGGPRPEGRASEDTISDFALDYLREQLFPPKELFTSLPQSADDLAHSLDHFLRDHEEIVVYGIRYDDGRSVGIHDVHMNQGSVGKYKAANGIYHDGALFVRRNEVWSGFFFAFTEESSRTDDAGNPTANAS
jgi:hypothetical protein